mmetsp:Transcript_16206/g.25681  ORF Transcript_16206/g.25681 Transcript_16206/m.25681 type:complete len:565 (-) Transcript_16206:77-1771(-)|eukprot:792202-Amorphochlora_amoeboformis.AAC.2
MSKKRPLKSEETEILEKKRKLELRLRYLQEHLRQRELEDAVGCRGFATPLASPGLKTPTSTTRSKRVVQRPQKFDEKPNHAKLSGSMSKCRNLVQALLNHKHGWVFAAPVDPVQLNIPTYFDIIKNPMDLATIKEKLNNCQYDEVEQFGGDVRTVWNNAIKFNGKKSDVSKMAMELSNFFEERYRKIPKGPFIRQSLKKKKGKSKKAAAGDPEVSMELTKLKREMDAMRKRINKYSKKEIKPMKNMPLSYKEKQMLRKDIMDLSPEKLQDVVEIVTRRMPQLQVGEEDEMEIDIDQLDIPTLRELQEYVRKSQPNQRRKSKTPRRTPVRGNSRLVKSPLQRAVSAPAPVAVSSSESDSSDSDSESDSSDSDPGIKASKQPRARASMGKKKPQQFGDSSFFSATAIVPENSMESTATNSDVKMNSDAWSNLGMETEQQSAGNENSKDELWANFQQKSVEMKQKKQEEEKLAKEAARAREQEYERMKRNEEEAGRLAKQRREEEDRRLKKQAEEADRQRELDIQARREAARRAREESLAADELEEQRAAIGGASFAHGSMADLLGE